MKYRFTIKNCLSVRIEPPASIIFSNLIIMDIEKTERLRTIYNVNGEVISWKSTHVREADGCNKSFQPYLEMETSPRTIELN